MNTPLPVGRLAGHLEALSREQVWLAVLVASAVVALLDCSLPAAGFTSAYIPVICGACWGLGIREGYLVAATSAVLSASSTVQFDRFAALDILTVRIAVPVAAFLFLAATINSFRRSYDRELFLAHHDRMTGVLNKEVYYLRSLKMVQDAVHTQQILLLIVFDLDDFKALNSRGGHQAGDEVIRNFAQGISALVRREDLIGRIGGDEFSLLARVPSLSEGRHLATDVHSRLSGVLAKGRYRATCSMGALLITPEVPRNMKDLMHAADQAMYRAKARGKNSVEIAKAPERTDGASATEAYYHMGVV